MRYIKRCLDAIRVRLRVPNTSKQEAVDRHFISKKRKRAAAAIKNLQYSDIVLPELHEADFT